jgi:hypothetical protein
MPKPKEKENAYLSYAPKVTTTIASHTNNISNPNPKKIIIIIIML